MDPDALSAALLVVVAAIAARRRPDGPLDLRAGDVSIERPRNRDHGDWATNLAMRLAKPLGTNSRELAQEIAAGLTHTEGVASVEVAGPGFINIRLEAGAAGALAKTIVEGDDGGAGAPVSAQQCRRR